MRCATADNVSFIDTLIQVHAKCKGGSRFIHRNVNTSSCDACCLLFFCCLLFYWMCFSFYFEIGIPYVKLQATNTASAADVLGIRHTPRGMESTQTARCKEEEILPDYSSKDGIRRRKGVK